MSCSFCAPEGAVADVEPHALFADEHLSTLTDTLTGTLLQYGDAGYDAARLGTVWAHEECLKGGREKFSPETHPTETWNLDSCEFPAAICVVAGVPASCATRRWKRPTAGKRSCAAAAALNGDAHKALDQSGYGMTLGHHGHGPGRSRAAGRPRPLEKLYGLSIDAWVEATVVTADGASRTASATEHPDLFWALRGGCGNFGVVTEFLFELMPFNQYLPSLQRVHLPVPVLCPSRFDVIRGWRDMCGVAPRNVSPLLIVTPTPLIELTYAIAPDDTVETLKRETYTGWGMPVVVELTTRCYVHEISWDILGPSSDANLAGNYDPTSALLAKFPDEACARAGKEGEIPNFKGSSLGRFPLVAADFWTSDHLFERSRSVDASSGTRARGTLTLKRR
ncbi:FAD-linked oxidase domain containing protein [Aureococcus anophagefferens]|nr:FAD-linked oxidase domain containing protein [Aureococcus anophagefferens]